MDLDNTLGEQALKSALKTDTNERAKSVVYVFVALARSITYKGARQFFLLITIVAFPTMSSPPHTTAPLDAQLVPFTTMISPLHTTVPLETLGKVKEKEKV